MALCSIRSDSNCFEAPFYERFPPYRNRGPEIFRKVNSRGPGGRGGFVVFGQDLICGFSDVCGNRGAKMLKKQQVRGVVIHVSIP